MLENYTKCLPDRTLFWVRAYCTLFVALWMACAQKSVRSKKRALKKSVRSKRQAIKEAWAQKRELKKACAEESMRWRKKTYIQESVHSRKLQLKKGVRSNSPLKKACAPESVRSNTPVEESVRSRKRELKKAWAQESVHSRKACAQMYKTRRQKWRVKLSCLFCVWPFRPFRKLIVHFCANVMTQKERSYVRQRPTWILFPSPWIQPSKKSIYEGIKSGKSGNTFQPQPQVFDKLANWTIFWNFNELLSTQCCI